MATSIARRSTILRTIWTTTASNSSSRLSVSPSPVRSNFLFRHTRISSPPSPSRLLRRELSSLLPVHTAIASACLVSKIPSEASTSTEGRFANYLSPI